MKKETKELIVKRVLQAVSALVVLALTLSSLSFLLMPKNNSISSGMKNPNAMQFLSEPENSLDVMIVGNSDAYSGFSPLEIWNEYGITSYVCGEGRQNPAEAYSAIQKMYKKQSPKVVVFETDEIFDTGSVFGQAKSVVQSFGLQKFAVFQYHDRWKKVKINEAISKPDYTSKCQTKGQYISDQVEPYKGKEYMIKTDKSKKILSLNKVYLSKIKKLCDEHGSKLIFVEVPSAKSWTYEKHNAVQKFADENDITFLDYDLTRNDYGFNWLTDTRDGGNHLNCAGAKKVSLELAKYIVNNYNIENKNTDEKKTKSWDNDYLIYCNSLKNHISSKEM